MTDISTENLSELNNSEHRGIPTPNTSNSSSSSAGRTTNSTRSTPPRLCTYFAQGNCRNGKDCRFSHDASLLQQHQQNTGNNQGFPQNQPYNTNASPSSRRHNYQQNNNAPAQFQIQPPHSPYAHAPILNSAPQYPTPSPTHHQHQNHYNQRQVQQNNYAPMSAPPPPMFVNIPPNQPVYCIDVECVATGIQHNARAVAQVAMVDQWSRVVYNAYIKQDVPVVSYLTEIHGLTESILQEKGIPLADALAELRSYLSPHAILVGQSIHKDIHWLQLVPGIDFHSFINLSDLFRVWNPQHSAYTNFSLDHCAKAWLGLDRKTHEAVEDAIVTMSLFNAYRHVQWFPMQLMEYQQRTLNSQRIPGFSSIHPVIDGCCMGNRKKCVCGAPFE